MFRAGSVWLTALVVLCLALGWAASVASAAEERCNTLGANCVCSEPLNTATYVAIDWSIGGPCTGANGCFWNPSDSTVKECSHEDTNRPISAYSDYHGSNDATALAALPTGHAVQRFGARNAQAGTWWIGAETTLNALGATFNARMAMRFYSYHGPNYNFRDEVGAQCHSKFLQGQPGSWHWENFVGDIHQYDFFGSNFGPGSAFPRDCCSGAPGVQFAMQKSFWRGRWIRWEAVVTNRSGPGVRHILYGQDVTQGVAKLNGGAEFVAADWFGTTGGINPWTSAFNTVITSSPRQIAMKINGYRETPTKDYFTDVVYGQPGSTPGNFGQCLGLRGYSHVLYTGWDTDAGQRIGAASEIESGGGGGPIDTVRSTLTGSLGVTGAVASRVIGASFPTRSTIRIVGMLLLLVVVIVAFVMLHAIARARSSR